MTYEVNICLCTQHGSRSLITTLDSSHPAQLHRILYTHTYTHIRSSGTRCTFNVQGRTASRCFVSSDFQRNLLDFLFEQSLATSLKDPLDQEGRAGARCLDLLPSPLPPSLAPSLPVSLPVFLSPLLLHPLLLLCTFMLSKHGMLTA